MAKNGASNLYTPARQMGLSRVKKTPNNSLLQITPIQSSSYHSNQTNTPPSAKTLTEMTRNNSGSGQSLLTPCRQMGLSRKRKASSLSQITPTQSTITLNSLELNTTPITSKIKSDKGADEYREIDQRNAFKEESVLKDCITKEEIADKLKSRSSDITAEDEMPKHCNKKKKVSKCLNKSDDINLSSPTPLSSNSDLFCDDDFKPSRRKKMLKCLDISEFKTTVKSTNKKHCSKNLSIENCSRNEENFNFKGFTALQINESLNTLKNFESIHHNIITNTDKSKLITNEGNLMDDTATAAKKNYKSSTLRTYSNKKKWKRTLSLKKSTEEIEKLDVSAVIKPCTIQLHKLNLQSEMINFNELSSNISKLESENEKQRKLLQELKQAQVYKKLHNIKDVEKSTETWKKGCIAALNDLFPLIKSTSSDIDMGTLLNNLGVPAKLIKLLPTGDLG